MKSTFDIIARKPEKKPQLNSTLWFQVYHADVKAKRPSVRPPQTRGIRRAIFAFSPSSQRNLLHTCRNSGHEIRSQFCLTYHDSIPDSGIEAKRHLDTFLKRLKRRFADLKYIWCLEFQVNRKAPHFHLFSDLEPTLENRLFLASAWVDVIEAGPTALSFHGHSKNMIPWCMKSGAYLAKEYIGKVEQKQVPENFHDVGRFWGASRNMKPQCASLYLDLQNEDLEKGIRQSFRVVAKHHEKKVRDIKRRVQAARRERNREMGKPSPIKRKNLRNTGRSVTLHLIAPCFLALIAAAARAVSQTPIFC